MIFSYFTILTRFKQLVLPIVFLSLGIGVAFIAMANGSPIETLRVCADPNNLPYSNKQQQGFENKIAELLAADLSLELEYTWFPQRMGFIRNTLKRWDDDQQRFSCDLVIGVPAGFDMSDTTASYYASTYAIVLKEKGPLAHVKTVDDFANLPIEQKRKLTVGAFTRSPAIDWLTKYDLFESTEFLRIMSGDINYYPGKVIEDELIPGNMDAVVMWGPIAGYFASVNPDAGIRVIPMVNQTDFHFEFAMAMGLRRGDKDLKTRIQKSVKDNQNAIQKILQRYEVPIVAVQTATNSALSAVGDVD